MPTLEKLVLDVDHAEALIERAIELEAHDKEMPTDKKGKFESANEIVAFCLDLWINHGIRPDDDEEDAATAAEEAIELLEIVGITVDDDNNVTYGELPEFEDEDDDESAEEGEDDDEDEEDEEADDDDGDDDEDGEDDDEAAFEPDDYLEGYSELSVKSKIATLTDLDLDDEDTQGVLFALYEWEAAQDKPSGRVMNWLDENGFGEEEAEGDDAEDDEDAEDESDEDEQDEDDDEAEDDEEEAGEPWEGYDVLTAVQIKEQINEWLASDDEDDELSVEDLQAIADYEAAREKPAPKKRVLTFIQALIDAAESEDDEDGDDDEDEEPEPKKRGRPKGSKNKPKDDDDDDVVSSGVYTFVYAVDGEEYEVETDDLHGIVGLVSEALLNGATELAVALS